MLPMFAYPKDFKNGFRHGLEVLRTPVGELHRIHESKPIGDMPTIRQWLDERGGTTMNRQQLKQALDDYETLLGTRDVRMDAYIVGMRAAYVAAIAVLTALFAAAFIIFMLIL